MGEPLSTHSADSDEILPWRSGRTFRLWRYGVGHSQLLLRSPGQDDQATLSLLFEGTEFVRVWRSFSDLELRLARKDETAALEDEVRVPIPLLRLMLVSPGRVGMIACSRVTARETDSVEDDSWDGGTVIFSLVATRRTESPD